MRHRWSYLTLLFLLSLGANGCRMPSPKCDRRVPALQSKHSKKRDLKSYLSLLFGKKLITEKGCAGISVPADALFHPDSAKVKQANWAASIDTVAAICSRYPKASVIVSAYTDCRHAEELNLALSELQAWTIKKALVDKGIAARKIRAEGWGESKPVASNATREGRKANRRIRITFAVGGGGG